MRLLTKFHVLEVERRELLEKVKSLNNNELHFKPYPKKWSIAQIMEHVRIAEKQTINAIERKMNSGAPFRNASIQSGLAVFIAIFLFKIRIPLKAPSFLSNIKEQPDIEYILNDWDNTRSLFRRLITEFPSELEGKIIFIHPILGPLALNHVLKFIHAHFKVHSKQISNLLKILNTQ